MPHTNPAQRSATERAVWCAFAVALAILAAISAISYANALRQEEHDAWARHTTDVIAALRSVLAAVTDVESGQRGFTIVGDAGYLRQHDAAKTQLAREAARLRLLTADNPAQQRHLNVLDRLLAERLQLANAIVTLRRDSGFEAARDATASGRGLQIHDQIRDLVGDMERTAQALLASRETGAHDASVMTRTGILAGTALAFGLVALALVVIGRGFTQRRRAEAALQTAHDELEQRVAERTAELARSHDNLRALVQQAPLCIALFDRQMRYLASSQRWVEVYGRGHQDLLGRCHYDIHPDLPERWLEVHRRGLAGESLHEDEDTWVQADGHRHWLRWAVHPWRDADGAIGGIIMSSEDITPRKRAELERKRDQELLGRTSALAHVGGWEVDVASQKCVWTDETARIHDVDPALEQSVEQGLGYFHGDSRAAIENAVEAAIADATPYDLELQMTSAKGIRKWIRTVGQPILENGGVVRIEGAIQDITERKQAEQQRDEIAQQLQLALSAARLGWWHYDPATRIATWDERYKKIFGVTGFQKPNDEILARLHPDDLPGVWAAVEAALDPAHPRPYSTQYRVNHPDGTQRWVEAHGVASFEGEDEARHAVSFVGTVQDVTERKASEAAVLRLNAELEARVAERTRELETKNRELETFTYSVSHDLKAPLRGIDGYSRLLLEDHAQQLDAEGRTFLDNVRRGTQQMGRLIDDLLRYSRIERRPQQLATVDPRALLDQLLDERAEDLRSRAATVNVDLPAGHAVLADREGLSMALRNLLDNALKFTRDVARPELTITGTEAGGTYTLEVRDNGVGFDMRFHDRIFEIFQRLHRSEEFPGTGVGLAIVRKAMERMGGRAWAQSAPGRGATFCLELRKDP